MVFSSWVQISRNYSNRAKPNKANAQAESLDTRTLRLHSAKDKPTEKRGKQAR
jgi:hypothetical protein